METLEVVGKNGQFDVEGTHKHTHAHSSHPLCWRKFGGGANWNLEILRGNGKHNSMKKVEERGVRMHTCTSMRDTNRDRCPGGERGSTCGQGLFRVAPNVVRSVENYGYSSSRQRLHDRVGIP